MNIFNARVDHLPVHPDSKQLVANVGGGTRLHADFASGLWEGDKVGIPITRYKRRADVPKWFKFDFQYADESDHVEYPIGAIESPNSHFNPALDHHMIVIIEEERKAYEVFQADTANNRAGSGAVWDLDSDNMRPWGWTSADASGYPVHVGIVTLDEVLSGRIEHALRVTVPRTWSNKNNASHSTDGVPDAVPSPQFRPAMGERYRLRADYDISGYGPQARVVLQAIKEFGLFVCDNGMAWGITGEPNDGWDNDQFADLPFGSALEVVDCSEWGLVKGSYAVPMVERISDDVVLRRTVDIQAAEIESLKAELASRAIEKRKLLDTIDKLRSATVWQRIIWIVRGVPSG